MVKKKLWSKSWTEHFLNRRVWGAVAGGLCLVFGALGWAELSVALGTVAGALGGWSYMQPKQ